MTWSKPESDMIEKIDKNVSLLIKAIAGDLDDPDKPGLQDKVRDLESDVAENATDHKLFKKAFAVVGLLIIFNLGLAVANPKMVEVIATIVANFIN